MLSERSCRDGILQVISLHALMKTPWKSVNASVLSSWSATTLTGIGCLYRLVAASEMSVRYA